MDTDSDSEIAPRERWATWKTLLGIGVGVMSILPILFNLIPPRLEIGPETTVIDSPLRPDGTPDFVSFLNDEWSVGVTPGNNAAIDLIRAFGPEIIDENIREAYFARLGIDPFVVEKRFLEFPEFLETQGLDDWEDRDRIHELEQMAADYLRRPWRADDFPELAAWLTANEQPLKAILRATQRSRFFSPLLRGEEEEEASWEDRLVVNQANPAARLLLCQAMLELGRGDCIRACELTLACRRLGRLLSEHPTMTGQLTCYAIESVATAGDQAIVLSGQLTADQAQACRQQLASLSPYPPMKDVLTHGERLMSLDMIITTWSDSPADGNRPRARQNVKWSFDPNPALRRFNAFYDEIDAAFAIADRSERRQTMEEIERRYSNIEQPSIGAIALGMVTGTHRCIGEWIGEMTVSLLSSTFKWSANGEERVQLRILLTDVGYALAAYRANHGEFPETLDALVPNLLPAVPLDPITGDPLKYSLKEDAFLLYSVGNNGIDDGGLMHGNADDVSFGITPERPDDE